MLRRSPLADFRCPVRRPEARHPARAIAAAPQAWERLGEAVVGALVLAALAMALLA